MLRVQLEPSRYLCAVFVSVHTAAALIVASLTFALLAKFALLAAIATSLVHALWRHAWLSSAGAITTVEFAEHELVVRRRDGECSRARLLGTTYVSPQLTVLNLRVAGCLLAQHMILVPDNVDPQTFRQVRVWLRWGYRTHP
jgi:toxin CptA